MATQPVNTDEPTIGRLVSDAEWSAQVAAWLPTDSDRAFVASLMGRVTEPGKFANWIAPLKPVSVSMESSSLPVATR